MTATSQLSVRLPEELRRAVKRAAAEQGSSVQAFVEQTLRQAVKATSDRPTLSQEASEAMLEFIRSGGYAEDTRRIGEEDPDLATM